MAHSVILGIFSTKEKVETAVDEMQRESFRNADISVLFRRNEGTEDFASGALGSLADIGVLANPGLGRLSPQVQSCLCSARRTRELQSAAWPALSSGWAF